MVLEATVSGQLWSVFRSVTSPNLMPDAGPMSRYLSNSVLCTRIRVQLGTALYAKTLRRKDTTGLSAAAKSELDDKKRTVVAAPSGPPARPPLGKRETTTIARADVGGEQAPLLYTETADEGRSPERANGQGQKRQEDEASTASDDDEKKDEETPATKSQM